MSRTRCDRTASRASRKAPRGGGVAILTREQLRITKLDIGGADAAVESLWLSVTGAGRRAVTIGAIYRPPSAPVARGLKLIKQQFHAAISANKPVIGMGDININMLDANKPGVRGLSEILNDLSLKQLVTQATHLHPTPTLLDLIITNIADLPAPAVVLPDPVADHQPVLLSAQIRRQRPPRRTPVTTRPWRRVNWDALCLSLLTADWDSLYDAVNIDDKLAAFMAIWNAAIDEHCPLITVTRRHPHCPWLRDNPNLTAAMEDRDTARAAWEMIRTPETRQDYQRSRNRVKSLLVTARREYLCGGLLTERRKFWSRLKTYAILPAGGLVTNEDDITDRAETFNAHFASVGSRVAAEVTRDGGALPVLGGATTGPRPPRVCASALVLRPATLPELSKAIGRMSSSRAVGEDGVPLHAIKECFAVIGPHLLHMINRSIATHVFPAAWKIARVTPIHKSGDRSDVSNFRPISILSVLSKITEKVVSMQLVSYLLGNHLLTPLQYAYRPSHCTEDAMLDAVEWISQAVETGHVASLTTIDLSKAFDSVDHGVLLAKLGWYGVQSEWFLSYLSDRKQMVKGSSSLLPLTHGVAQGSIVGPILFLIFINDMPSHLPHGRLLSYADDTTPRPLPS